MNCTTINSQDIEHRPVVEQCTGCERISANESAGKLCSAFAFPETKWRLGACSMATHIQTASKNTEKQRVGQQKQKKR